MTVDISASRNPAGLISRIFVAGFGATCSASLTGRPNHTEAARRGRSGRFVISAAPDPVHHPHQEDHAERHDQANLPEHAASSRDRTPRCSAHRASERGTALADTARVTPSG